jgi:glycosyltransferase involved in cell wall biosynthesis
MRITYISIFDMQAASTIRLHSYAAQIARLGHNVTFIAAPGVQRPAEGMKIEYMDEVKQKPFRGLSLTVSSFSKLLSLEKPDIVHFGKPLPILGLPSMLYKEIFPCSIICDWDDIEGAMGFSKYRSFPEKQIISFFEKWIPNHVDGITVVSKALEKLAKEYCSRVLYLPHLAPTDRFGPWISGSEFRKKYGWVNKKVLIFTGGFGKYSDADICVKAMPYVLKEEDALLALFGNGETKPLIKKMIVELGLEGNVKVYDAIPFDDMPKLLAAADVLLAPMNDKWTNNFYRLPIKVFEYMAAGKPIVTQDVGEARTTLGNTAYITKSTDEDFAKGIVKALHGGKKIGLRARKRAEKEFTIKQVKRLENFYESFK